MASFKVPYVPTNISSWGPPPSDGTSANNDAPASNINIDEPPTSRFAHLPFAPFSRSDRLGRCADFTTQSFARTGDATFGTGGGFRNNARGGRDGAAGGNKNLEFQYKVDLEESRDFLLVDSSKAYGSGGGGGGNYDSVKRFVPQARRKANTQRLRQLNARRNDGGASSQGVVGRYNQPQRTRAGGR